MHYGDSRVLGLQVCWEYGALRWYDPSARRYLDTFDSMAEERDSVAAQRDAAVAAAERLRHEIARLREGRE